MKLPSHIEQELRRRWRHRGYCEIEILSLLEFFSNLANQDAREIKKYGFKVMKQKQAA